MVEAVSRRGGVALWRQIQQALEADISSGTVEPGQQMPTEQQLAQRFGVNRHTVRRALQGLEDKGLVRIEQGRGTFVHEHVIDYAIGRRTRFTQNLNRQSRNPAGRLLTAERLKADDKVARSLELAVGAPILRLVRTGMADGRVVDVADHYFPLPRFDGLLDHFRDSGSVTEALKACGVPDYTRKHTRILARLPSGADADILRQPRTRPVLITEGIDVDSDGRPVDFGITRWASDWVQIVVED